MICVSGERRLLSGVRPNDCQSPAGIAVVRDVDASDAVTEHENGHDQRGEDGVRRNRTAEAYASVRIRCNRGSPQPQAEQDENGRQSQRSGIRGERKFGRATVPLRAVGTDVGCALAGPLPPRRDRPPRRPGRPAASASARVWSAAAGSGDVAGFRRAVGAEDPLVGIPDAHDQQSATARGP